MSHACMPEYIDVNLLAKFIFKNMDDYYQHIEGELLKISKRGKSEKQRYRMFLERLLEEIPKRVKSIKNLDGLLKKESAVEIPAEQIVSGCIKTKNFSQYFSCYLENKTLKTLNKTEHEHLRKILEITYPHFNVDFDTKFMLQEMQDLKEISVNFTESELLERLNRMKELEIIKGAYFGIPWGMLGYKTKFIIGQLDFDNLEEQAYAIAKHHRVQEVNTIVGTYDVIVKVRFKNQGELDSVRRHIGQFISSDKQIELDVVSELKTKFRMVSSF